MYSFTFRYDYKRAALIFKMIFIETVEILISNGEKIDEKDKHGYKYKPIPYGNIFKILENE